MCVTCGCGNDEVHIETGPRARVYTHTDGTTHAHRHADGAMQTHTHEDGTTHSHAHAEGAMHSHARVDDPMRAPGDDAPPTQARRVQIERDLLAKNDAHARRNRAALDARGIFALNLVSAPGAGKTSLLVRTIEMLGGDPAVAVIEGDQQTSLDADRIRATGASALQINTGKGCHLDAAMVETALARLEPPQDAVLVIENVGNLVCPAAFDLGEAHKVVVLSVTEGEDKPLKYPDMFCAASLMLLNKTDLLPHLRFDIDLCCANARRVNPGIEILQVSATSGAGMDNWLAWVRRGAQAARQRRLDQVDALQRRVAELEAQLARLQPP